MRNGHRGLVLSLLLSLAVMPHYASMQAQAACTHYASPSGGGTGRAATDAMRISDFWAGARPGMTLCLLDGRYTGPTSMIDPPRGLAGTAGARITVRALHDGKAWIDGQSARRPLQLQGNHFFTIEGVNVSSSSGITLFNGPNANHNTYRRVIAWDTLHPDGESIIHIYASTGTQLIDVAGFGSGRKVLGRVNDRNSVVLRGRILEV